MVVRFNGTSLRRLRAGGGGALPLDFIGQSSTEIAYSLRRLFTAYTGPLIQIRDAGGDTADVMPDSFGFVGLESPVINQTARTGDTTLETWLAIASFATITTDYDQSGNGRDATQINVGNQKRIWDFGSLEASPITFVVGANCSYNAAQNWTAPPSFTSATTGNALSMVTCATRNTDVTQNAAPSRMGNTGDHWGFSNQFYRGLYGLTTRPAMNPSTTVANLRWSEYLERTATPTLVARYVSSAGNTYNFSNGLDAIVNPASNRNYGVGHISSIFGGWVHEFFQFNRPLTNAERDALQADQGATW